MNGNRRSPKDGEEEEEEEEAMIKKLLNNFLRSFTFDHDREKIEQYLAQSTNTYDLEQRMRELDQKGKYNQFYI